MHTEKQTQPSRQGGSVSLWLPEKDTEQLKAIAREKGIGVHNFCTHAGEGEAQGSEEKAKG
jgi:hypothetical protein